MPELVHANGQSLGATPGAFMRPPNAAAHRMGLIAARVGYTFAHRLTIDTSYARAGTVVHLDVQDATRFPDEADVAKWVCTARSQIHNIAIACACTGKAFDSKRALLEAHAPNEELVRQHEVHVFMAVYERRAQPAQPERKNEKGETVPAVAERPAVVMLLSDEA